GDKVAKIRVRTYRELVLRGPALARSNDRQRGRIGRQLLVSGPCGKRHGNRLVCSIRAREQQLSDRQFRSARCWTERVAICPERSFGGKRERQLQALSG